MQCDVKTANNSISLKVSSLIFHAINLKFSGYDFCMITKKLHLAIYKKLKKKIMTTNIKKSFFLGLKKKVFLLKINKIPKWSPFIIK